MSKILCAALSAALLLCVALAGCKKTDTFEITQADVEYISKTIITMLHSAQQDAISDATSKIPLGSLGGPVDWTPGGDYLGIHIQGSFLGHTDYSADADTSVHMSSVSLDPFDSRAMDMEIVAGSGTIITHVDKGWLQDTFNLELTLRLKAVNYAMSFSHAILYFDMANMRLTATVIFDHTSYAINISFIPSLPQTRRVVKITK